MAISVAQHAIGTSAVSTSTVTVSLSPAVTSSQAIAVWVLWFGSSTTPITSVKDNGSPQGTFTSEVAEVQTSGGVGLQGFFLNGPTGSPTSVTVTFQAAIGGCDIEAVVMSGQAASPLDLHPAAVTGSGTTMSAASITPSVNGELIFMSGGCDAATTASSGNLTLLDQGQTISGGDGSLIQSTAALITPNLSLSPTSPYVAGVMTFKPAASGGVAWGFDEETLRRSQGWRVRAVWHARPAQDEFIRNPTQFAAPPWVHDPDYFPRRLRSWRAHPEPIREEFLNNPTQFPAPPWVHDPDYFPRRRQSWRAHPEPLREEFLNNPTQTVFSPWIFDDQQRLPRAAAQNRKTQQIDDLSPPAAAAPVTAPYLDDQTPRLPRRASKPSISQSDIEGLPFTAATPLNWADLEQSPALRRSVLKRGVQMDEQIGLPQLVGAGWGFDEEPHRLQRAIFHRLVWQDDLIGLPQLVGVPWGFDEEQHWQQRRIFHRLVWQDDPIGLPQLVGVPWGFEEDPQHQFRQRIAWRARPLPLADEFLFNPTQIVFSPWRFEEQRWRLQLVRWHAHPQPADNEGWPFSVIPQVPWGGIEQGIQRRPLPARRPVLSWVDEDGWIQSGVFPLIAHWGGNVWWITANGGTGARAWVSIGLGPNPSYQTRLRSMYLVLSGSSATSAMMVVRDGPTQVGTVIFQADLYTASNGWDFLDFNGIDLRATVGNVLTVEFVAGTPSNVQQINAGGDYVLPGTSWGV